MGFPERRGLLDIESVNEFEKAEITQSGKDAAKSSSEDKDEIGSIDREMIAKMSWKGRRWIHRYGVCALGNYYIESCVGRKILMSH